MHSLPLFHRIAGARIVVAGENDMAEAKRRLVERAGGTCVGEIDKGDARLAFVAIEDGAEEAAARLKAGGLLVNVADRPDLCDFTLPSVLERGDVLVAVSTGGASAGLAKHLRLRLEAMLPPTLGALAAALNAARAGLRARWPEAGERRRALDAALAEGGALDPFRSDPGAVARWLAGGNDNGDAGDRNGVFLIELASNDPDDLTLRQARLLGTADVAIVEGDVPPAILARLRADAVRTGPDAPPPPPGSPGVTVILRAVR